MGRTNQTDGNKPTVVAKKSKKVAEADESIKTKPIKDANTDPKKKRHWHPGTVAKREVRKYQRGTELLLRKGPFQRIVRRVLDKLRTEDAPEEDTTRVKYGCFPILQESTESYMINLYRKSSDASRHAKRVTLMSRDVRFMRHITEDGRIATA